MKNNLERMIALVDEVFDVKNDPGQLQVNEAVMMRLQQIHPATLSAYDEGNGPVLWILVVPTLSSLMDQFLNKEITEQQLVDSTPVGVPYDVIYLCSAIVLPEYRRKGMARKITIEAIKKIETDHKINTLFYWGFTPEGDLLAQSIAAELGIALLKR